MEHPLRLGISACLLGEPVRYDGQHKLDHYLRDILGAFVEYVPVCPEFECGLGVPREAMHLEGDIHRPRLVTIKSKRDLTEEMESFSRRRVRELAQDRLCGFIFKSKSPSSGMERVKVYQEKGMPVKKGAGIFARIFQEHFPLLPVEEEGRLQDIKLRENFIERILVMKRWLDLLESRPNQAALIDFHARHKLLIMAHSPSGVRELGRLLANPPDNNTAATALQQQYLRLLMKYLKLPATVSKNTNVLHHIMGYFKKVLTHDEKQELLEIIAEYQAGAIPLVVPVTLLRHYLRKFPQPYLETQLYLHPHPLELQLRNHA